MRRLNSRGMFVIIRRCVTFKNILCHKSVYRVFTVKISKAENQSFCKETHLHRYIGFAQSVTFNFTENIDESDKQNLIYILTLLCSDQLFVIPKN